MMDLYEIHTHLYGCLDEEDLNWLGSRKPPRWDIYKNSYYALYKKYPDIEILYKNNIFHSHKLNNEQRRILRNFYLYDNNKPTGFSYFQLCFDFIISLAHTDPEELREIALRVSEKQKEIYSEYRMMFSPFIKENEFKEKVLSLIEGLQKSEEKFYPKQSKLIISLNREYPAFEWQYEILKQIYFSYPNNILLGIDFAGKEEGDPPENKTYFIKKVLEDNLYIVLYHVGESFLDKSPSSAIRWILQVYEAGVHRIGHAVALSYEENKIKNKIFKEHKKERISHLKYLINAYEKGEYWIPMDYIKTQLNSVLNTQKDYIGVFYTEKELKLHIEFLNYVIDKLKNNAIIESCPTSNIRICGFSPLKFFLKKHLTVCIGADDPGIFDTSLEKEFQYVYQLTKDNTIINQLKDNNKKYCSLNLKKIFALKNEESRIQFNSVYYTKKPE